MYFKACIWLLMVLSQRNVRGFIQDLIQNENNRDFKNVFPFRRFTICFGERCLNELELSKTIKLQRKLESKKVKIEKKKKQIFGIFDSILREFNGFRNF